MIASPPKPTPANDPDAPLRQLRAWAKVHCTARATDGPLADELLPSLTAGEGHPTAAHVLEGKVSSKKTRCSTCRIAISSAWPGTFASSPFHLHLLHRDLLIPLLPFRTPIPFPGSPLCIVSLPRGDLLCSFWGPWPWGLRRGQPRVSCAAPGAGTSVCVPLCVGCPRPPPPLLLLGGPGGNAPHYAPSNNESRCASLLPSSPPPHISHAHHAPTTPHHTHTETPLSNHHAPWRSLALTSGT